MFGFILLVTFIIMIGVIWLNEGWKMALKIIGLWFSSVILIALMSVLLDVKRGDTIYHVIPPLLWGVWTIGLIFYNIKNGYIGK